MFRLKKESNKYYILVFGIVVSVIIYYIHPIDSILEGDDCKVINRKIVNIKPPGIILTLAILSLEVPSIQLITSKRNVRKLCD